MITTTMQKNLMHKAIEIAKINTPKTDIPIASILVPLNEEIESLDKIIFATNTREIEQKVTGHAEINVIEKVGKNNLNDWCLISTLEPCVMCYGVLNEVRIGKLVFGAFDNNKGAFSKYDLPRTFDSIGGIQEEECSLLIKEFFKSLR